MRIKTQELFAQENPLKIFKLIVMDYKTFLEKHKITKKLKFIFISTCCKLQKIVNENSTLEILSYYNLHKFYCENLIKLFSNFLKISYHNQIVKCL